MATSVLGLEGHGIFRHSRWDALLVSLALAHGILLLHAPSALLIALGLWWNSNTISHNFIHRPFFRRRILNLLSSLYLSLLLGIPQSLWRERHLAHHSGIKWRARMTKSIALESIAVVALWLTLLALNARFFWAAYASGYLIGLGLCFLHGHYEHAAGTTSHYGSLYNLSFFNDGYHVEHHELPAEHWTRLPRRVQPGAKSSRWPAVLRWIEVVNLDSLERLVLRSQLLQQFVLKKHERALGAFLPELSTVQRVAIVGGGLFPRTALILQRLMPQARLTIIDVNLKNIKTAQSFLNGKVEYVHGLCDHSRPSGSDLVIFPLSYIGDRSEIYSDPPAPAVLVHDWIWNRRGKGVVVSRLLLKRMNLIKS